MFKKMIASQEEATSKDIIAMTGPLDSNIIDALLHAHATRDEIAQALNWLEESHYTMSAAGRPMSEHMREVYQILDYASNDLHQNKSIH